MRPEGVPAALVTFEWHGDGAPPVIELTNGVQVTCTLPAITSTDGQAGSAA